MTDLLVLLGIHADHRLTRRLMLLDLLIEIPELGVPMRVLGTRVLALPCKLKPACLSSRPTVGADARYPCMANSSAR